MMRHILILVLFITIALSACDHHQGENSASPATANISVPANPNDAAAWEGYMVQVSQMHNEGAVGRPYLFIVPSRTTPGGQRRCQQIQQALADMASRNGFPGNVIAVGGPDPSITADVLVTAFGVAKPASLKTLAVLYVGDDANKSRAEKSIANTGAAFRYAKM